MNASIKGEFSKLIIWDIQLAIQGPECLANPFQRNHVSIKSCKWYGCYVIGRVSRSLVSIFFGECWQIKNLNNETHLATWPWGGHHLVIITDDVDKNKNLRKWSDCECYHQAHMHAYLFITFAPVKRCVDMVLRCFVSTFTDGGRGIAALWKENHRRHSV